MTKKRFDVPILMAIITCSIAMLASSASADTFFPITSVETNTVNFFAKDNLIQGSGAGFDANEPHNAIGSTWVTDAPGGGSADYMAVAPQPIITLDLGQDRDLSSISSWGYADGNANGVSEFSLRFATEADGPAGFGTSVALNPTFSLDFPLAPRQQRNFGQTVTVRYVEYTVLDNYFGLVAGLPGGDRVGLGEIAFAEPAPPMPPAPVGPLPVVNGSFEDVTNPGATFNAAGTGDLNGWFNISGNPTDAANVGSQASSPTADAGTPQNFLSGFDGSRAGHINNGDVRSLAQNLGVSFVPGNEYTLSVNIGRRVDHDVLGIGAADWQISLNYADDGTLVADLTGSNIVGQGGILSTEVLSYTALSGDEGREIQIRLTNTNAQPGFNAVNFDIVTLAAVPEPSTCLLALVGLLGLVSGRRRRRS